jgi:hypothetical protein
MYKLSPSSNWMAAQLHTRYKLLWGDIRACTTLFFTVKEEGPPPLRIQNFKYLVWIPTFIKRNKTRPYVIFEYTRFFFLLLKPRTIERQLLSIENVLKTNLFWLILINVNLDMCGKQKRYIFIYSVLQTWAGFHGSLPDLNPVMKKSFFLPVLQCLHCFFFFLLYVLFPRILEL